MLNIKFKNMLFLFSFALGLQAQDQNNDDMIESQLNSQIEDAAGLITKRGSCCNDCKKICCLCVSDLTVTGRSTLKGKLIVNGIFNSGNETISGGLTVGGNLVVGGQILGSNGLPYTGTTGSAGGGSTGFASFFALMPGDNASTVAVGAAVQFPQDGFASGSVAARASASTFTLAAAGYYEVTVQVSVTEAGQLQLALNGTGIANTVAGRATGTSQIVISTIIQAAASDVLSVINPVGNSTALTITPIAGGASSVSATITIKYLGA